MPDLTRQLARAFAHFERRSVQLLSLLGLGIGLLLMPLMPFSDPPARGTVTVSLVHTAPVVKGDAPLVLPPPSLQDREARATDRVARAGLVVRGGGGKRRLVALTFDDGPGPFTEQLIKTLVRLKAPATFFQVGRMLDQFSGAAGLESETARVVIGDHTYSHGSLVRLPRADQEREILSSAAAMLAHGESPPRLFRPPYGVYNDTTLAITRARGMAMILWNVDSADYTRPGAQRIVQNVVGAVKPGSIVLMHDAGGDRTQTVAALPGIVRGLRKRGYGLVTVPELLYRDPPVAPPTVSSAAAPTKSPAPQTARRPQSTGR